MSFEELLKKKAHMLKEFLMEDVEVKVTGESNDRYDLDLIIDMDGFYLKTSFIAYRKDVDKWKREHNYKSD
ncbi:MAG: hypothetical protein JRE23_18495 [Deltaproteobacteria bacterium]|nr:hypothetical protein [Deltaproteobacteria bacterium]